MRISFLLSCAILLTTAVSGWCQLADTGWPDYGGGYANQHRSPYVGPSATPKIAWAFDLRTVPTGYADNRGFHQPILLDDGTIVLNTADSRRDSIVALNPDGTYRWHVLDSSLGPWLAADENDRIYTIRNTYSYVPTTRLRAVSFSGSSLWTVNLSGRNPTQNGPAIARDGTVYASNDHSPLTAVTPEGTVAWTSVNSGYYVNPAIDSRGTIYVGGRNLTALRPDGSVLWSHPARGSYLSPAIGDDGTIYAGEVSAINLVAMSPDGNVLWTREDLGGAPAVGINGEVYVVPASGVLHALNPLDGSTLWSYNTGKTDYYSCEGVTVDRLGSLYFCNENGVVMSLTSEGQLRWSLDLAPDQSGYIGPSAPIIGRDGTLYVVGGYTGKVFAIVPEPSMLAFLAAGAVSVIAAVFRRRNHARSDIPGAS